ncbi:MULTISPECIES: hypothetical protein [unclassified Spiroplasma]|uniref:hypothetical protein n=1 Tax=unclassified Spiroplasma TaxID=2637901 RepID=UPI0030D4F226
MNDNELIYLYCIENNEFAFNFLYKKYELKNDFFLRNIIKKFFAIPLETNDLKSTFYFIFLKAIFKFQERKNKSFQNFLYYEVKWGVFTYVKSFLNNNHKIINCALKYNDYLYQKNDYEYTSFLEEVISITNFTTNENEVLKLKRRGYNVHQIMKKLNLSYKQVDNAWTRVKLKLKNSYKKYI